MIEPKEDATFWEAREAAKTGKFNIHHYGDYAGSDSLGNLIWDGNRCEVPCNNRTESGWTIEPKSRKELTRAEAWDLIGKGGSVLFIDDDGSEYDIAIDNSNLLRRACFSSYVKFYAGYEAGTHEAFIKE